MNDLIVYILKSSACLVFFYFLYWIFLKSETYFFLNRVYLILSVFASLAIPLLKISLPFLSRAPVPVSPTYEGLTAASSPAFGLKEILLVVYLTGVVFFLFRFCWQLIRLFSVVKKKGIHKHGGLNVVFVDNDLAPSSFFHFIFLNPDNISQSDFNRILAHELVHIKQFHSMDIILLELLAIFQWFNPFVWPYRESLKETHEYLADKAVVAQGCSRAQYQLLILEQHVGGRLFEFVNNFRNSQIKRRLTMMSRKESREWSKLKLFLVIPLALILIGVFADTKPVDKDEKAGEVKSAEVAVDKKADDEEKDKQKQKEIEAKIKELKKMYAETDDPDEKAKIKEKAAYLMKILEGDSKYYVPASEEQMKMIKELKMKIAKTEDPEKKKKLEHLLQEKLEAMKVQEEKQKKEEQKKKEKK